MKVFYYLGRLLQLAALIVLPSSIWISQWGHNPRMAEIIFVSAILVFFIGWLLAKN